MGILNKVTGKINEIRASRRRSKIEALLRETEALHEKFKSEAKRFGIDTKNVTVRDYYEILGIAFTDDEKAIRQAYVSMIKKYHPDVSKDVHAKERSEDINEAYAELRDKEKKAAYDAAFSKGGNRMGTDVTKNISNMLLKTYFEIRAIEFAEFNKRVASPQSRDAIRAAIDDVLNWHRRFDKATDQTFGRVWGYGRRIRKLNRENKNLLKGRNDQEEEERLAKNSKALISMLASYDSIEKGIYSIMESTKIEISKEEAEVASRLRNSV